MKKVIPADATLIPEYAKRVFEGMIFDVYQWPQKMYDGSEHTFEMLKRPDTVLVIGMVEDKILIIDDEQPYTGLRRSFPGGRVDKTDESIKLAAQREVLEETGYSFNQWKLVKVWQPHNKIEWFIHLLVAWDVSGTQAVALDPGEKISVEYLNFEELKSFVINKSADFREGTAVIEKVRGVDELIALTEFSGQTVDR